MTTRHQQCTLEHMILKRERQQICNIIQEKTERQNLQLAILLETIVLKVGLGLSVFSLLEFEDITIVVEDWIHSNGPCQSKRQLNK